MEIQFLHFRMYIVTALCFFVSNFVVAADLDPSQVAKEIRVAASRLQAAEDRLEAWKCTIESSSGGQASKPLTTTVMRHNTALLVKINDEVSVFNETGYFSVKSAQNNLAWVLIQHKIAMKPNETRQLIPIDYFTYPLATLSNTQNIIKFLDNKTLNLIRARSISNGLVELEFEYAIDREGPGNKKSEIHGTLTLDPNLDWLVMKYLMTSSGGLMGPVKSTMSRQVIRDGDQTRVVAIDSTSDDEKGRISQKIKYTYQYFPNNSVNPAEFTLAYYNLIAPGYEEVYEDKPKFNWTRWGIIGIGCIVLSLILGWYVRRRRPT